MADQEMVIIDESNKKYNFVLAPNEGAGKRILINSVPWEPADGAQVWRVALHPWNAGLGPNRINPSITLGGDLRNRPSMVYAKGWVDSSQPNYITFPPKLRSIIAQYEVNYYNSPEELYYGGSAYGTYSYMGAVSEISDIFLAVKNFNNKAYFAGGQFLLSITDDEQLEVIKDFGSEIYDLEVFNNELVIALGETVKMQTMNTSEAFTVASNDTFAIALGRTQNFLWRAESVNKISNCITAPLTLTSWSPSAGTQYEAGDTTYSITDLHEYGGAIAAVKPDGVYIADHETKFHNQTPQLAEYPHEDNGRGIFNAWGFMFVPSVVGLLRVTIGESFPVGPELSNRPDYRFWVRSGVEWNRDIFLVCNDEAGIEETVIIKMSRQNAGGTEAPYAYHEYQRLGTTDISYVIIVYHQDTHTPSLIAGISGGIAHMHLGRGQGADLDDPLYEFGEYMEIITGQIMPNQDRGIKFDLTGSKVVGKQVTGGAITIQYEIDKTGVFRDMYSNREADGQIAINEAGYLSVLRFAEPNTIGNALNVKLIATMPEGQLGTDRTEIEELWVFGNSHPESTEVITVDIYNSGKSRIRGLLQGRSSGQTSKLFRRWHQKGTIVQLQLPDYDTEEVVRVKIIDIVDSNIHNLKQGDEQVPTGFIRVTMRRVDYAGALNG